MTQRFYNTIEWFKLRSKARALWRQSGKPCPICLQPLDWIKPHAISVDHIKPRKLHPELALELRNLQCLCKRCHDSCKQAFEHRGVAIGVDGLPHGW